MTKINFGESTSEEEEVTDRAKAREIVQVVLDHGVSQNQVYHMIYLLALELENQENMKKITRLVKKITSNNQPKSSLITGE
tara:strand:+ start:850 stop:1092 length:243 start_codon:yes stop_codon:yes gene_type:complete